MCPKERTRRFGEKLQRFSHVLAGAVILIKAFSAFEHHPGVAAALLALGLLFISAAILHHSVERLLPIHGDQVLHVLEAITLTVVTYEMVAEHKRYLQYAYGFTSIIYFGLAIAFPKLKHIKARRHSATHS